MHIMVSRIALRNFKGIKALDVDFGAETSIFGQNALGKTTIFDGFLWLLFGKDSQNKADFEIKPLDADGSQAHNLESSVEAELLVDSRTVRLKKVYAEKWTKRRGAAKAEFTGHTTDHWFDGVPVKEKEYQDRINGIVNEGVFRLVTDPRFFNESLHWQERRRLLMDICGEVSVHDVIASDASLAGLLDILNGKNDEDAKKLIASKRKEINDQLEKIPVRIDEAKRSMVEIPANIGTAAAAIEALEKHKAELESQLTDLKNGGAISKKRIELADVEAEIREQRNLFAEAKQPRIAPLKAQLLELQDKESSLSIQIRSTQKDIFRKDEQIKALERELVVLRDEWDRADAQEVAVGTTCPTCKRPLPEDEIAAAKGKLLNAKAGLLANITERGKEKTAQLEELVASRNQDGHEVVAHGEDLEEYRSRIKGLQESLAAINAEQPDLTALEEKKASILAEISNHQTTMQGLISDTERQLSDVKAEIASLQAELGKVKQNETAEQRVAELEEQEKKLAKEYEKLEADLFKVENYIRAKVALLERRINEKFELARFKLFEDQINGGLKEVCETTLNGVPYPSINNAGRIQVGLDIIKTLQAHHSMTAPVWIDNRESVVRLPEMGCQIISLIVSEQDKALRVENGIEMKKAGGM